MFNPLHLNCPRCGGELQAKDSSDHGKHVRCPRCQEVFQLQLQDRIGTGSNAAGTTSGVRPRKKYPGRYTLLILLALGLALGTAALFYRSDSGTARATIDLTYLPNDTDVIVRLGVSELLNSPVLRDLTSNPATEAMLTLVTTQTGISLRQVESITLGVVVQQRRGIGLAPSVIPRSPFGVMVIRSFTRLDPEAIAVTSLKGTRQYHAGSPYYKLPLPAHIGFDSCYFPEPNVVVVALESDLKLAIDQGAKTVSISAFDFVRTDQTLIVAATAEAFDRNPLHPPVTTGINLQALESELKQTFQSGSFGLSIKDKLDAEVILNCLDRDGAGRVQSALETNLNDVKSLLKRQASWLNLSGMADLEQLGRDTLNSVAITQTNEKLTVIATVPAELKIAIAKYTAALSPFLPGGMPFGLPAGIPSSLIRSLPSLIGPSGMLPPEFDPSRLIIPTPRPPKP